MKHLPVARGFATWCVNRVGPVVVQRSSVVLLFGEMTGRTFSPATGVAQSASAFSSQVLGMAGLKGEPFGCAEAAPVRSKIATAIPKLRRFTCFHMAVGPSFGATKPSSIAAGLGVL